MDSAKNHSGKITIHNTDKKKIKVVFVYFFKYINYFPGEATTHCFEIRTANVDFFVGEDSNVPQVGIVLYCNLQPVDERQPDALMEEYFTSFVLASGSQHSLMLKFKTCYFSAFFSVKAKYV